MTAAEDETGDRRPVVTMIGPLPPPMGGVANFLQNVRDVSRSDGPYAIDVYRTGHTGSGARPSMMAQAAREIGLMGRFFFGLRRSRTALVHVHTSSYQGYLRNIPYMLWVRHLSDAGLVVHIHGGKFKEFYEEAVPPVRYLVRKTLREADTVVVTSPSWTELVHGITGLKDRTSTIPNGFDPSIFHPIDRTEARVKLGIPLEGKVLVNIGYLETVKGHTHLINALKELKSRDQTPRLYIIGNGTLRERLMDRVKELGLDAQVTFVLHPEPPSRVALWMGASDAFILPSLHEGNPTVMFETLGCGRAFIGTRVGGIPDVITSPDLGVLCDPGDASGLANCIDAALGRAWDPQKISAYALRYSWNSIAAELSAVYDSAMDRARKRSGKGA
jgi:glycosyltransferase involved in cell wall biosynthesis